jgi:hypothetical protein
MSNIIQFNLNNYLPKSVSPLSDKIHNIYEKSAGKTAQESGALLESVVWKCLTNFRIETKNFYYVQISEQPYYENLYNEKSKLDFLVQIFNQPYNRLHLPAKQIRIMIEVKQLGGVQSHFQKLEWFFTHAEKGCFYNNPLLIYDYNNTTKSASKKINSLDYRMKDIKKACEKNNININVVYLHNIFKDFFNKDYIDNLFLKTA